MSWKKVKLGDVCTIEKGAIGIQKAVAGEYPLVVTGEERKSHNEYQFNCEAVIVPLVSGTGHGHASIKRIHFQSGKFALGNILCAIIPKDTNQLMAQYLYRFLDLNKENELVARMKGMANVTLPIKEITLIEIPLPSVEEQAEFVEMYLELETKSNILSTELTHQLSLVKKLRQQFLQDAVQGRFDLLRLRSATVAQRPANEETGADLLKKIKAEKQKLIAEGKLKKEKELPPIKAEEIPFEIPEGWVWCRLGDLFTALLGGFAFDSTRYSKTETSNQIIRLGNVKPNQLVLETTPVYIDEDYANEAIRAKLFEGNILITMTGTRAKKDYLFTLCIEQSDLETKTLYLNQRVGCFRFGSFISPKYINLTLKDLRLLEAVFDSSTGAANQANIGITALKDILIPLPPFAEQTIIVAKLDELMQTCDALEASIKESAAQNEKLLQQVLREALRKE